MEDGRAEPPRRPRRERIAQRRIRLSFAVLSGSDAELPIHAMPMKRLFAVVLLCLLAAPAPAEPLPRPPGLEAQVELWRRVYAEVDSDAGLIHDDRQMDVVYEELRVPRSLSRRDSDRRVKAAKKKYADALKRLATGKRSGLSETEKHVLALWPPDVSNATLRSAARRVRFQRGLADRFREGVIRAGRWQPFIEEVFREAGLPAEIAALPHVESSFNPHAYSSAGAAGLWQFTRSTGRLYMHIDYTVDERFDPYKATEAASRLLIDNHADLKRWPLAITAYNHGRAGMQRAVRSVGSRDIAKIVDGYNGRAFKFASRNFYAELLAAIDVSRDAERYFGPLEVEKALDQEVVELQHYYLASSLERALGIPAKVLRENNLSLRSPVWRGQKYVPRGYGLRIPRDPGGAPAAGAVAAIAASERFTRQKRDTVYSVRRGDTLSQIASRYGTTQSELVALNGLRSRHRIRIGQRLRLPSEAGPSLASLEDFDGSYRVRRGDSVSEIARRFGVAEAELVAANGLRNKNRLYVGQTLQVPVAGDKASKPKPTEVASAKKPAKPAETPKATDESPEKPVEVAAVTPKPAAEEAPTAAEEREQPKPTPAASEDRSAETEKPAQIAKAASESEPPRPADATTPAAPQARALRARARSEPKASEVTINEEPAEPTNARDEPQIASSPGASPPVSRPPPVSVGVGADDHIVVEAGETLGHYADWLELATERLRRANGMRRRSDIVIGQRVRLDFSRVSRDEFEARRLGYHESIQTAFFADHRVAGTSSHVLRRGDTLWSLSRRHRSVPLWLLRQYNPEIDLTDLQPGVTITIPRVQKRNT
jgi:membrane-bound lytic murein transglycosylase D